MLKSISLIASFTLSLSTTAMAQNALCQNGHEIQPNGACVRDANGQCVPCPVATPLGGDPYIAYIVGGGIVVGTAALIFTENNSTSGPVSP